jgi:hypothetical protein
MKGRTSERLAFASNTTIAVLKNVVIKIQIETFA